MSEWIDCKDRMPDQGQRVLVSEYGETCPAYFEKAHMSHFGHIPDKFRLWSSDGAYVGVTHWMPMPEAFPF